MRIRVISYALLFISLLLFQFWFVFTNSFAFDMKTKENAVFNNGKQRNNRKTIEAKVYEDARPEVTIAEREQDDDEFRLAMKETAWQFAIELLLFEVEFRYILICALESVDRTDSRSRRARCEPSESGSDPPPRSPDVPAYRSTWLADLFSFWRSLSCTENRRRNRKSIRVSKCLPIDQHVHRIFLLFKVSSKRSCPLELALVIASLFPASVVPFVLYNLSSKSWPNTWTLCLNG